MNYRTVMVQLQVGRSNAAVLQTAGELAERLEAALIGIAARRPMSMVYADGYMPVELFEQDRALMTEQLEAAEVEFRTALQPRSTRLEWRSSTADVPIFDTTAAALRSADLLITGAASAGDPIGASSAADIGDLVMHAGRPVLLVPARLLPTPSAQRTLQRAVVLWNDSRESRRAVVDAMPLLRTAAHVAVVGVAAADDLAATRKHVIEVAAWLDRHGIAAEPVASLATGDHAQALEAIAGYHAADLIVAGAYGHSRLREWVLGGVTRDLLLRPDRCTLLSH